MTEERTIYKKQFSIEVKRPKRVLEKEFPATFQTYWNITAADNSGKALQLYLFYVQCAIDQNSSQPWAIDSFCARRLRWHIKTVAKFREILENMEKPVIKHFKKRRANYVRVHYMTERITGSSVNLQTDKIPPAFMGTYVVFDYYTVWMNNIRFHKNFPRFQKDVAKKLGYVPVDQDICNRLEQVWDKICVEGWAIVRVDSELSFHGYMSTSVANKFKERN
jgi:hypothetical protein